MFCLLSGEWDCGCIWRVDVCERSVSGCFSTSSPHSSSEGTQGFRWHRRVQLNGHQCVWHHPRVRFDHPHHYTRDCKWDLCDLLLTLVTLRCVFQTAGVVARVISGQWRICCVGQWRRTLLHRSSVPPHIDLCCRLCRCSPLEDEQTVRWRDADVIFHLSVSQRAVSVTSHSSSQLCFQRLYVLFILPLLELKQMKWDRFENVFELLWHHTDE